MKLQNCRDNTRDVFVRCFRKCSETFRKPLYIRWKNSRFKEINRHEEEYSNLPAPFVAKYPVKTWSEWRIQKCWLPKATVTHLCALILSLSDTGREKRTLETRRRIREKPWLEASATSLLLLVFSLCLLSLFYNFAMRLGQPINTRRQTDRVARNWPFNATIA